jgi:hypothetical protein
MQAMHRKVGLFRTSLILYKDEGFLRFWKGSSVIAQGCIPAHASYFSVYEYLKHHFDVKH